MSNLNGRRLVQSSLNTGRRYLAAAKKPKKMPAASKAKCPPKKKVCRYVFPYPKNIDLFSLRPEPYCIATGGPCDNGKWALLIAGLVLTGISTYLCFTIPINLLWYSFDEEDGDED